ncbi:MAG: right-handed parallel beta-helix repeat-containing protein [Kofleriaceae bacterium]
MRIRLASGVFRGSLALLVVSALALGLAFAACSDGPKNPLVKDDCTADRECAGTATPYCLVDDGVCVGCLNDSQCSGATPVCAAATHTCEACTADTQCASGVCLAALGTCAAPAQLLYVKEDGGVDNGECDEKAPCATINYAKNRTTADRNVIRVIGGLTQSAELQSKIYLDGDGSVWTSDTAPIVSVSTAAADVTIEGFSIEGKGGAFVNPAVECLQTGSLHLHQSNVKFGQPAIFSVCKLNITSSKITNNRSAIMCSNSGAVAVADSEISAEGLTLIETDTCEVKLERNRISGNPGPRFAVDIKSPGKVQIENNLLWDSLARTSSGISVTNGPTGGVIRFNTIVNTAGGVHTGDGVVCDGTTVVSSNVIAWQGGSALAGNPCARRYNAFDSATPVGAGEGNTAAALSALFVDPAADFHLASGSPAIGLADPADKIDVDLEGKSRPATGRLDAGAFETP